MDRTWREEIANTDFSQMSFRQKLMAGGYTYQAITTRMQKKFQEKQKKVGYLEDVLFKEGCWTDEEKFALKNVELQIAKPYSWYRWSFMLISMMICVTSASSTKRSLPIRILPTLVIGPFYSYYNHTVGQYGVHRNIDKLLPILMRDEESNLAK